MEHQAQNTNFRILPPHTCADIFGLRNSSGVTSNALQKANNSSPDNFLLPVIIALNLLVSILISGSYKFIFCVTQTCVRPCSSRSLFTVIFSKANVFFWKISFYSLFFLNFLIK